MSENVKPNAPRTRRKEKQVNVAGGVPKPVHMNARIYAIQHGMTLKELIAKAVTYCVNNDVFRSGKEN